MIPPSVGVLHWKLRVVNNEHNHLAAEQLGGHPYAMRLNENETRLVEQLSNQNMLPRDILAAVKDQNPDNVSNLRNIYNARRKSRIGQNTGETPIQTSYNIWRAFPHVLLIDTTYKTNKYNMPFVQIVGVTSTHKTFSVAHAFISKEREENFVWVLQNLKDTLQQCMEPRVIVTDRELALINACRRIFPSAAQLLCRWHIFENISKHCRPSFSQSDWQKFGYMWSVVIESATPDIYEYNYSRLHEWLWTSHQRVIGYLQVTWLQKYKEMFVSAWIDKNRNFGQRTTNRVESQHSLLKKSLHATNNTLDNIVGHVIQIVKSQAEAINESFERSKIFRMAHHNDDQFELLKGNVSHVALDLLVGEKAKIQMLIASNSSCGCHLFTSCGLPCACRLLNNAKVTLDEVDLFWRKLDLNPSLLNEDEGADIDAQLDRVIQHIKLQPNPVKKSMMSKVFSAVFPFKSMKKEPVVQTNTRGRPSLKTQQKKQEPARHSSFTKPKKNKQDDSTVTHDSQLQRANSYSSTTRMHDWSGFSQPQDGFSQPTVGLSHTHYSAPLVACTHKNSKPEASGGLIRSWDCRNSSP
ncbi:hypothetical protein E3N88_27460 [Mikania micrantha]|uniref:MULE transposase domain-containing protein n=1 Tax=Mikania micrantha TaxID=192012 RepID=A0A5N6MWQ6_9ASTR|nr:hypothetical protein E3N88_27460 [Mikania micrantha]